MSKSPTTFLGYKKYTGAALYTAKAAEKITPVSGTGMKVTKSNIQYVGQRYSFSKHSGGFYSQGSKITVYYKDSDGDLYPDTVRVQGSYLGDEYYTCSDSPSGGDFYKSGGTAEVYNVGKAGTFYTAGAQRTIIEVSDVAATETDAFYLRNGSADKTAYIHDSTNLVTSPAYHEAHSRVVLDPATIETETVTALTTT